MKYILYYSNHCNSSKNVLFSISRNYNANDICFICIDKRIKNNDGTKSVILENGQQVPLPPNITHVPSLMLLNRGFNVIQGDEHILKELLNTNKTVESLTSNEPIAFSIYEMNGMSDNYSYFNLDSDQMSAKGNGGLSMMHGFARIDQIDSIQTPSETDKSGNSVDLEKFKRERDSNLYKT